jgi:hypothetical protein
MKKRYCFECGKLLDWTGFELQNRNLGHDYIHKLWNHDSIEFYCCECFKEEMLLNRGFVYFSEKKTNIEDIHKSQNFDLIEE